MIGVYCKIIVPFDKKIIVTFDAGVYLGNGGFCKICDGVMHLARVCPSFVSLPFLLG